MKNPNTGRDDRTISRSFYEPVRTAILEAVAETEGIPFSELTAEVVQRTEESLWQDASAAWYTVSVKLHLEAIGQIERFGSPQQLRLTSPKISSERCVSEFTL